MTDAPSASRASLTPPVDSTREMAATRLGQVTQKLVGISRVRSFSITLGSPKGQRAATRNGRGARPSCRATASRSLELSAISYRPSAFSVRRRYSMAFKYTDRDRVVIERSVHHLAESWPLSRLRHDIHLLTRPDHAVVFTGGAFDAGGGLQLFYGAFSRCVLRAGLLQFLFQGGDLGPVVHYVLEGLDVGGEEDAQEGRVQHDRQRPQSPGYVHPCFTMLPLYVLTHGGNLDNVRRARHGPRRPARKYNLVAVLEVSDLPRGLDCLPETVLQRASLLAADRSNAPHQREHPDRVLDGAYGQNLVRRPEAGDPYAREPRLGRGQDGFGLEVFGQLAGGVGNGIVAVAASPGRRCGDVAPVVDSAFCGTADPLHLLHAPFRVAPDGRLAREHHRVGPVEDGVCHVRDLGTRRTGVPDHGVEHLRGDDDRFAQTPATGDHTLLLYGHPLGRELDGEIPAGDHDAVGGRDDVLYVVYRLVLLDFGDNGRVAAELLYPLLDLPDLVGRAHEGHGHPVGMKLLHPEPQIFDILWREPPDGERGVGEV